MSIFIKSSFVRIVVLAFLLLILGGLLTSCSQTYATLCKSRPDRVHNSFNNPGFINAKGRTTCGPFKGSLTKIEATIYMYREGLSFPASYSVHSAYLSSTGSITIPVVTSAPCVPGQYYSKNSVFFQSGKPSILEYTKFNSVYKLPFLVVFIHHPV